jgi:hypothetical protein
MTLSTQASTELKELLCKNYGEVFISALSDEEINHIGLLFLEIAVQGLKLRAKEANC